MHILQDTLIKTPSLSAPRSCVNDVMIASLKSADSVRRGQNAPLGGLRTDVHDVDNYPVFHKMYTGHENPGLLSTTRSETVSKRCEELIAMISDLVCNVEIRYFLLEASKKFAPGVMFKDGVGL